MDKCEIAGVKVKFVQEGNTLGTTQECETLELSMEFQSTEEEGPFYVIKTDGWSFDDVSEIQEIINRANSVLKKGKK